MSTFFCSLHGGHSGYAWWWPVWRSRLFAHTDKLSVDARSSIVQFRVVAQEYKCYNLRLYNNALA